MRFKMRKTYQIIHVFLLASLLGLPACKTNHVESSKPLNGEETAQLVSKLYNELGPRIGVHLVEPNAVLTIAGLRGNGNFLMHDLTADEKRALANINATNKEHGIGFLVHDDPEDGVADINISNLKGLEYSSKISKFPFITHFDSSTGYEGQANWVRDIRNKAEKYFKDKGYITKEGPLGDPLDHFMVGLNLGYPDQALVDHYRTLSTREETPLASSNIPYGDYYKNPQPNFEYLPNMKMKNLSLQLPKHGVIFLRNFIRVRGIRLLRKIQPL